MKKLPLILLMLFIAIIPSAFAEISSFNLDFSISLGRAYVMQNISYDSASRFEIDIPYDATDISVKSDGKEIGVTNDENLTVTGKSIEAVYLTKKFIDNKNFVMELAYPEDIGHLEISLTLPSNVEILMPIKEGTLESNAIFPKADSITSDGQRIKITWERDNVKKGDSISILVRFREKKDYSYLWYILIIAAAIIAALAFVIARRKPKVQTVVKTRTRKIEEHLKEDEAQIVRILKSRERQCEQGTLRVITGFSKAKLSGLLKELEDRKIIYKEKRGKKNIVFLK